MLQLITTLMSLVGTRLKEVTHNDEGAGSDRGATAIEWAIFAILALTIAGLVAGAIMLAVNNRLPSIA